MAALGSASQSSSGRETLRPQSSSLEQTHKNQLRRSQPLRPHSLCSGQAQYERLGTKGKRQADQTSRRTIRAVNASPPVRRSSFVRSPCSAPAAAEPAPCQTANLLPNGAPAPAEPAAAERSGEPAPAERRTCCRQTANLLLPNGAANLLPNGEPAPAERRTCRRPTA